MVETRAERQASRQRSREKRETRKRSTIRLRRKTTKERRAELSLPLRIITSPKTTVGLGLILGTLINPLAAGRIGLGLLRGTGRTFFGTFGRSFSTLTGIGILTTSPLARGFLARRLRDPTRTGREIGKLIEDPSKLLPEGEETTGGKFRDILERAGLVGGAAVLGAAGISAVQRFRERRQEQAVIPSQAFPSAILPAQPSLTPRTQPLGAAEKEVEPEAILPVEPIKLPSIKITNKPQINISFRKTRRFINQQVLIK